MAVTVSHPAVIVPLRRFGLIFSALVVGSLIPDFEFFLSLSDGRLIAHSIPGIFLFCIPVGFLVLLLFHKLIKNPLMSLLPRSHQCRLYPVVKEFKFLPLSNLFKIIVSLFIGASSHLVWDACTHADGWFVHHMSILSRVLFETPWGSLRVYFALQYLSSAFALLLMIYWYKRWFFSIVPEKKVILHSFRLRRKIGIGFSFVCFSLAAGIGYGYLTIKNMNTTNMLKIFITHSSIAMVSSLMLALVVFGIAWHYLIPHHKRITSINSDTD